MKLQSLKRFAAASLCAVMVVGSMSACGSSNSQTTTTDSNTESADTTASETADAETSG